MMQGNSSGSISIRKKSKPSDPGQPEPGAARDSLQDRETASVDIADHHISVLKERAADDLRAFFDRKGVPRPRADEFKIHINYKGTCDGSYSVHYSDRRGEMYLSRSDVYASLDKPSDKKDHIQATGANRAQRNCVREMQRRLDPEILKQQAKEAREAEAKEKEKQRQLAAIEKEKKDRERDFQKEQKLKEKEVTKEAMKFKKEVVRKDDRSRAAVRRDVAAEQKAARAEALSEVLARFDMEEDTRDLQSALAAPAVACAAFQGPERLSVLDLLADPASIVDVGSLSSQELENVLDITATLQALQGFFKLPSKVHHLDDFLACIEAACASPPTSQSSSEVAAVKSVGANEDFADGAMEVTTSIGFRPAVETVEGEPEAETGHTAQAEVEPTGPSELDSLWESHREGVRAAEAELDRIQLNMLFPVVQELNSYLGLEEVDEKDAENRPRREKKNTLEHNSLLWSLPLNQLTFAELLRMCSIMRICQEMEKPIEETEYLLKGGQALQYTVAKNIARSIRYRMLVRSRLSAAFEEDPVLEASIISSDQVPLLPPSEFGPDDICDKLFAKDFSTEFLVCTDSPPLAFDGDDLSSRPLDNSNLSFKIGPVDFDFSSENDLIDSVLFAADGPESHIFAYNRDKMQRSTAMETDESPFLKPILNVADIKSILPGVYRRCCKVWIKLASMPFAKNFMWEVDKDMFPDYFQLLKNPMSLSAVAYRLSKMQYGDPLKNVRSAEEGVFMVASRFYKDVRSVCLNCITYNSEKEVLAGQASRMLMALHQHIVRWVLPAKKVLNVDPKCAISRPAINCCDEFHCLYTCKPIEQPTTQNRFTSIKCGRCSGVFSHSALKNYFDGSDLGQENEKFSTYGEACVQIDSAEGTAIGSSATVDEASSAAALSKDDPMKLFFIAPTDEIISQISEEWLCLLCLRDDFTGISENFSVSYCNTRHLNADSNFFIDEWGASTHMPWFLNPSVSNFASDSDQTIAGDRVIIDGSCGYGVIAKGVQIENLNDNVKYTLLSRKNRVVKDVQKSLESTVYPGGLPPPVLILQSCSRVLCDSAVSALLPQFTGSLSNATYLTTLSCGYKSRAYEPKSWSRTDRLVVLRGLCELIRNNAVVHEYLSKLNKDCEMLVKLSSPTGNGTSLPVEATFVEQCKCVAGDDGLTLFRRMMNRCGEGDDSDGYGDDVYAQNAVIAGRCYVCKGSTFEDDCPKPEDCVLLCDGCNAEAHLRCVSLGAVPSGDWYCESCSARIAARDNSDGASLDYLEEVNQFRSTDKEVGLLQNVIERREDGIRDLLHNHKGAPLAICAYCGMTELQTGSPFVIGQSRPEYEAYIDLYGSAPRVDDILSNNMPDTLVKFSILLKDIPTPRAEMPKFPILGTSLASRFLATNKKQEVSRRADTLGLPFSSSDEPCPIVHELCALNMFRNRVRRQRHSMRRRRRLIAERVIQLSGINTEPLGFDDNGFSYWKLPMSDDLFICVNGCMEPQEWKKGLAALISRGSYSKSVKRSISQKELEKNQFNEAEQKLILQNALHLGEKSRWIRISDVSVLVRLVYNCLSDDTPLQSSLRRNLASVFLTQDRISNLNAIEIDSEVDAKVPIEKDDDDLFEDMLDGEGSGSDFKADSSGDDMEVEEEQDEGNNLIVKEQRGKATKLMVQKKKGVDVPKRSTIQQESVFDEADLLSAMYVENDIGSEDLSYLQYFSFGKSRFYAVALVDDWGSRIKTENIKKGTRVVYQVHREGVSQPLAYTPLDSPWGDDGIFYFATLSFKRSGHYIVTFLVEGSGYAHIKPIVHHINVEARIVLHGSLNAWNRLNARNYAQGHDRQITWGRRELNSVMYDLQNELCAVRSVLLTTYAALPNGAFVMGPDSEDSVVLNDVSNITEPSGWNRCLDKYWRSCVFQATTAQELMECTLLFEFYIARQWLYGSSVASKPPLLSALPAPHFAIRNSTFAAVALRLYCLDRVLLYDKVETVKRGSRIIGGDIKHIPHSLSHSALPKSGGTKSRPAAAQPAPPAPPVVRQSRNSGGGRGAAVSVAEFDSGRIHRAAYDRATKKIASGFGNAESSEDSDDGYGQRRGRREKKSAKPDDWNYSANVAVHIPWACLFCSFENLPKARSCEACGERKPSAAQLSWREDNSRSTVSRRERMKKRGGYEDEYYEDVSKKDESADSESASDQSQDVSARNKNKRYRDTKNEIQEAPVRKKRGRKPKQQEDDEYQYFDFEAAVGAVLAARPLNSVTIDDYSKNVTSQADLFNCSLDVQSTANPENEIPYAGFLTVDVSLKAEVISPENDAINIKNADAKIKGTSMPAFSVDMDIVEFDQPPFISVANLDRDDDNVVKFNGDERVNTLIDQSSEIIIAQVPVTTESTEEKEQRSFPTNVGIRYDAVTDISLRMLSVLRRIHSDVASGWFWEPVPLDIYTDYKDRVKEPMDLGTIASRVASRSHYGTNHAEFARDVNLVWSNCKVYNLEGSEISLIAERFGSLFADLYKRWIVDDCTRPQDPIVS